MDLQVIDLFMRGVDADADYGLRASSRKERLATNNQSQLEQVELAAHGDLPDGDEVLDEQAMEEDTGGEVTDHQQAEESECVMS